MESSIEKTISNLIEHQFPEIYRDDGPVFVEFVKQYYSWLEGEQRVPTTLYYENKIDVTIDSNEIVGFRTYFSEQFEVGEIISVYSDIDFHKFEFKEISSISNNVSMSVTTPFGFSAANTSLAKSSVNKNALYYARRHLDNLDIDRTTNDFLVYFKEKYLKNIQLETTTNTRALVKHTLDLYRSKGTPRAIDLLFRLVFGTSADVYLPGKDIFKLSTGKWTTPVYLEVGIREHNTFFVGKQIFGLNSGATAFAERVIRRKIGSYYAEIIYITSVVGNFQTGELINAVYDPIDVLLCPTVVGSLTYLPVVDGGYGFHVGDILDATSITGRQGKARVVSIIDSQGRLKLDLVNGGWGFTPFSQVLISNNVLTIADIDIDYNAKRRTIDTPPYVSYFETMSEPMATIGYTSLLGGTWQIGDNVAAYYANSSVKGSGQIYSVIAANSTSGNVSVFVYSGSLNAANLYGISNTVHSISSVFTDETVTANVMGVSSNAVLYLTNVMTGASSLRIGQVVSQSNSGLLNGTGKIAQILNFSGANTTLRLTNTAGFFQKSAGISVQAQDEFVPITATLVDARVTIGVINVTGGIFNDTANNRVFFASSNASAKLTAVYGGADASAKVDPLLLDTEDYLLDTDPVYEYVNRPVNAITFKAPEANSSGTVKVTSGSNAVIANTASFSYVPGNILAFYSNSTSYQFRVVASVPNSTIMTMETNLGFSNNFSNYAVCLFFPPISNSIYNTDFSNVVFTQTFAESNSGTIADLSLTKINVPVGKVAGFVSVAPGSGYGVAPFVDILEPYVYGFSRQDYIIYFGNTVTSGFQVGEVLQQPGVNATGNVSVTSNSIIITGTGTTFTNYNVGDEIAIYSNSTAYQVAAIRDIANNTLMNVYSVVSFTNTSTKYSNLTRESPEGVYLENMNDGFHKIARTSIHHDFQYYVNIIGKSGGSIGTPSMVIQDYDSKYIGFNSTVNSSSITANGSITGLQVVGSGFGFGNGQSVSLESEDGTRQATATSVLGKQGISLGYYINTGGFLSSDKRLYDGYYYQDLSYEVRSSLTLNRYRDMLNQVLHAVGTKSFGAIFYKSISNNEIAVELARGTGNNITNTDISASLTNLIGTGGADVTIEQL